MAQPKISGTQVDLGALGAEPLVIENNVVVSEGNNLVLSGDTSGSPVGSSQLRQYEDTLVIEVNNTEIVNATENSWEWTNMTQAPFVPSVSLSFYTGSPNPLKALATKEYVDSVSGGVVTGASFIPSILTDLGLNPFI